MRGPRTEVDQVQNMPFTGPTMSVNVLIYPAARVAAISGCDVPQNLPLTGC
jgi:hypothetical protein